jgi:hypothetical protein
MDAYTGRGVAYQFFPSYIVLNFLTIQAFAAEQCLLVYLQRIAASFIDF